ncbi:uncharacterized protein LOC131428447 [Malaya genurostris]|uniref:uncharacterized protein LOC131428447 n=1 Tax=Malaya genurostris TaxID=325434 RepID=UPI0026F3AFC6|nr:uncharacterized protein LOC131428447 [Malaya genurostris]
MSFFSSLTLLGLAYLCLAEFTDEQQEHLNQNVEKCADKLGIELNSDFMEQWKYTGNLFPDEEKSKMFAICLLYTIAALDADETINTQNVIDFYADGHDVQALTELVQECNISEGINIEDTAYNFYKCFWTRKTFQL